MNTKYSVLMSIFYKEKLSFLIDSIESMLKQTVPPEQIVIVKDGKLTDELNQCLDGYKESYPSLFTLVPLAENVGLGLALNEGLNHCRNQLVARMDTDDIALPIRCEIQLKAFKDNEKLSILGSNVDEFYEDPNTPHSTREVPSDHEKIIQFSKRRSPFNHPSVMYRRDDVLECDGYGNYRRNQDYDLFVRMLNAGYYASNINQSLLLFRANKDNLKRRKSWQKCKGDIGMRYKFWKKGYLSFSDFIVTSSAFLFSYLAPMWLFERISNRYLRKGIEKS